MKRIVTIIIAALLCVSLLAGCGGSDIKTKNDKELNETVVAKIGDVKITQAYYNFIYSLLYSNMAQYEQYYGADWINMEIEDGKTIGDFIKENTMSQIEQLATAVIIAEEKGIKADSEIKKNIKEQKKSILENYGGEDGFVKFLESSRTTDDAINTYLEMYEVYNKLFKKITSKGGEAYIEDKEIQDEFLSEYADKLRVQHILVSTQEQTNEETGETKPARSDEEALKIVNEIIGKLDKGESFDSLITEYDEDPGMEAGKFYVFGAGEMVAEFEEASKNLAIGDYTKEGVKTSYGYHIIKRYDITTEIDEFKSFKETKAQEKITEIVEKKIETLKIKWEEKVIDKYVDKWNDEMKKAAQTQNENQSSAENQTEKAE